MGAPPPADPEQIIAWDGSGGTTDGQDYSASRAALDVPREQQVDAIAHGLDALFNPLRQDRAHLIFAHDDRVAVFPAAGSPSFPGPGVAVPATGLITLSNNEMIGGSGDISLERSAFLTSPQSQGVWAPASDVNGMPAPGDVDGLEVWGPEPAIKEDANHYSLEEDFLQGPTGGGGTSVWYYDEPSNTSVAYISHGMIVQAVEAVLGPVPGTAISQYNQESTNAVNLDALMVQDVEAAGQFGPGDSIIFSISQMIDTSIAGGYYATGSELIYMELDAAGGVFAEFLDHGGHLWSRDYAVNNLQILNLPNDARAVIDINGIEAIGALLVPEPASLVLVLGAVLAGVACRRRA